MNNFKLPYIVYPIVLGFLIGWLISSIAGSLFMTPKPIPAPSMQGNKKERVQVGSSVNGVIETNIFDLELTPQKTAELSGTALEGGDNGSVNGAVVGADGKVMVDSKGNPLQPPPPFKATLIGIVYNDEKHDGVATIELDNMTLSISLGKTKEGITLIDMAYTFATIEKEKKKYSIVLDIHAMANALAESKEKKEVAKKDDTNVKVQESGSNINITVPRAELKTELQDLNKVLQSALISPFYQDNKFMGYRVARIKPDSPLTKLGLNVGDVITRINGSDIQSPAVLFQMLSQLDDISAITVDMLRNNQKKSVFVEIQ